MQLSKDTLPFYLCTGFHRSGTSLLAQTLHANQMHMGGELMGATFSNPLGHVEDMPVVRLHDKIYQLNGTDWRYHDTSPLIKPMWLHNYIGTYINERRALSNSLLGVKDPRAIHFLNDWKVAGGKNIKFIFIYRHWTSSCFSLLNRHARHLLNNAHPIARNHVNFSFWTQPSLAFEMWLSANKRILEFVKANKDSCLLLSQEALVYGNEHLDTPQLADKMQSMSLSSNIFKLKTYDARLQNNKPSDVLYQHLDAPLLDTLNSLYADLQAHADMPNDRVQETTNAPIPKHTKADIESASPFFKQQALKPQTLKQQPSDKLFANAQFDFSKLSWVELAGVLLKVPIRRVHPRWFNSVLQRDLIAGGDYQSIAQEYFSIAKVAHRQGLWLVTKLMKMRAMLLDSMANGHAWQLSKWSMFCEKQLDWLHLEDQLLINANPFSIRKISELPDRYNVGANTDKHTLLHTEDAIEEDADKALSISLLTQSCDSPEQYLQLIESDCGMHIKEFILFKALRVAYKCNSQQQTQQVLAELYLHFVKIQTPNFAAQVFKELCALLQGEQGAQQCVADSLKQAFDWLTDNKLFSQAKAQVEQFERNLNTPTLALVEIESLNKGIAQLDSELRPNKGLKHRFALLPHSLDYSKILSVGYEDEAQGKHLDMLNRRLNLFAKSNFTWLNDAGQLIVEPAFTSLKTTIDRHWQQIFDSQLMDYLFLRDLKGPTQIAKFDKTSLVQQQCLAIKVDDFALFSVFVRLLDEKSKLPNLLLFCKQEIKGELLALLETNGLHKFVKAIVAKNNIAALSTKEMLNTCISELDSASYLCVIDCTVKLTAISPQAMNVTQEKARDALHKMRLRQVMTWYCMLGYEFELTQSLQEQSNINMLIPSYAPFLLNEIQDKPLFFPLENSFWIKRELAQSQLQNQQNQALMNKPALQERQFVLGLLNYAKQQDGEVMLTHQFLHSHFPQ